jgi:hypothetical protein
MAGYELDSGEIASTIESNGSPSREPRDPTDEIEADACAPGAPRWQAVGQAPL